MATLASAMIRLDATDRDKVEVVFVTTDPARDTGPVLRHYLDRFDPTFVGVTGPLPKIKHVARRWASRSRRASACPAAGYDVTHGTPVLAIDGTNTVPVVWTHGTTAPEFASDIHQLLS